MGIALWIVQILLGLAFLAAGAMKVSQPADKLIENGMGFIEDMDIMWVRVIGVLEILGGLGLVLPMRLDILPFLTPLAAIGLMIVMVGAVLTHVRRNEISSIVPNIVLGALAGFVFWQTLGLLTI